MRKVITGILIILLVACFVVMGVSIAFIVNGGENPFNQSTQDNDQVVEAVALRSMSASIPSYDISDFFDGLNNNEFVVSESAYDSPIDNQVVNLEYTEQYNDALDISVTIEVPSIYYLEKESVYLSFNSRTTSGLFDDLSYFCVIINSFEDLHFYSKPTNYLDDFVSGDIFYKKAFYIGSSGSVDIPISDFDIAKDYYVLVGTMQYTGGLTSEQYYISLTGYINFVSNKLPDSPPLKTGYTFTGWYTDPECTQLYEEDTVTSDITLYAGWRVNKYTIKFDANGGFGFMANVSCAYDKEYVLSTSKFGYEGYKFIGWATTPDGDVEIQDNAKVKNLTAEDGATVTLYAVWEQVMFNVTFIVDDEIVSIVSVPYGTNLADIINSNVNDILYFVSNDELENMTSEVTENVSVTLQKTFWGNIVSYDWFWPAVIGACALFVIGIFASFASKRKGGV